jgi:hypothetical protein
MQTYTVTVDEFGTTFWFNSQGQLHRENGPAIEYADGSRVWCQNGKVHRVDGPAIEYGDGSVEYWISGKELTQPVV